MGRFPRTNAELAAALDDATPHTNDELVAQLSNRALVMRTAWQPLPTLAPPKPWKPPKPKPRRARKTKRPKVRRRPRRPETTAERLDRKHREAVRAQVAFIRAQQAEAERSGAALAHREERYNRTMDALAAARLAREHAREYRVTCARNNQRLVPVANSLAHDPSPLNRLPLSDEDRYC